MPCAEKQSAGKRNEEEDHFERTIATVRGKPEKPFDEAHIDLLFCGKLVRERMQVPLLLRTCIRNRPSRGQQSQAVYYGE